MLIQTGYRKPISTLTMNNTKDLVSAMIDYHLMLKVKSMMYQFMEGLSEMGVLKKIQEQPLLWEPLFLCTDTLLTSGMNIYMVQSTLLNPAPIILSPRLSQCCNHIVI